MLLGPGPWMLLGPGPGPWVPSGSGSWVPRSSCPRMLLGSCPCMPGWCCPGWPGAAGDVPGCVEEFVYTRAGICSQSLRASRTRTPRVPAPVRRLRGPACRCPQLGWEVAALGTPLRAATAHSRGGADSRDGLLCSAAGSCPKLPRHLPGPEAAGGKRGGGGLSTGERRAGRAGASLGEPCCQSGSSCLGSSPNPARGAPARPPIGICCRRVKFCSSIFVAITAETFL